MTPWNGRNALTAVIHFFDNVDGMRSSMRPEARVQGVIVEGGAAPNVVPDKTVADFYIRYPDEVYLAQVSQMVDDAAPHLELKRIVARESEPALGRLWRELGYLGNGCSVQGRALVARLGDRRRGH